MNLVELVEKDFSSVPLDHIPEFRTGDTLSVHVRIIEGDKSRIQVFKGTCIAIKSYKKLDGHFLVRKVSSGGVGVERLFPFYSPIVAKVEIAERGKSRRAKHFYLRQRTGKSTRLEIDYDRQ